MSAKYDYIDLPSNMNSKKLEELRTKIKELFLEKSLISTLSDTIHKHRDGNFSFVDFTVYELVNVLHPLYKLKKQDLLRFILLVLLGNDALPQEDSEPRYHNTKVLLNGVGPLKDELIDFIKKKFPDVECKYPGTKKYPNYVLKVYFGKCAEEVRADFAFKKAAKLAKKRTDSCISSEMEEDTSSVKTDDSNDEPFVTISTSTGSALKYPKKWDEAVKLSEEAGIQFGVPEEVSASKTIPEVVNDNTESERILQFAQTNGVKIKAALVSEFLKLAHKDQISKPDVPIEWSKYGNLIDEVSDALASFVVNHPECIPETIV
jgi:hypothetical protein